MSQVRAMWHVGVQCAAVFEGMFVVLVVEGWALGGGRALAVDPPTLATVLPVAGSSVFYHRCPAVPLHAITATEIYAVTVYIRDVCASECVCV